MFSTELLLQTRVKEMKKWNEMEKSANKPNVVLHTLEVVLLLGF